MRHDRGHSFFFSNKLCCQEMLCSYTCCCGSSVVLVFLNKRHDQLRSTNVLLIETKNSLQTRSVVNPVEFPSVS